MAEIRGFDFSNWQGAINWDAVKTAAAFAIVKASESTNYKDVQLDRNKSEMRRVGLARGFYHFARGGNAQAEAEFFVACVGDIQQGEVLVLDYEINIGDPDGWCSTFINRVKQLTGITCIIYMSESVVTSRSWEKVRGTGAGLWVAKYGSNNGQPQGAPNGGNWDVVAMWQYTSVATCPGVAGNVDANIFYGDVATFQKYGNKGGTVNPPTPTPTPNPNPPQAAGAYTVVAGDSLSLIGQKTSTNWQQIAQLNGINPPYVIYPGQSLKLPGGAAPAAQGGAGKYVVQPNDTLSGIGAKTGVAWPSIAAANGIAAPYTIYPNQVLAIPGAGSVAAAPSGKTYTIKSGDTLSGIAAANGTTYQHLAEINGIADPNRINAGQVIKLG